MFSSPRHDPPIGGDLHCAMLRHPAGEEKPTNVAAPRRFEGRRVDRLNHKSLLYRREWMFLINILKGCWHRNEAPEGVTMLHMTPREGGRHSWVDPES